MSQHLHVVDEREAAGHRVVVVWADEWDYAAFDAVCEALRVKKFVVLNELDEMSVGDTQHGLRDFLVGLAAATHIAIAPTWWTSMVAHQIVQLSSWLGIDFIDHAGIKVPTASLKSRSGS